jgi:hypothetical protein
MKQIKCAQCNGTGYIDQFKHIQAGKCFTCDGTGILNISDEEYNRLPKTKQQENELIDFKNLQEGKIYKAEFPMIKKGIKLYFKVLKINTDTIDVWFMDVESISKKLIYRRSILSKSTKQSKELKTDVYSIRLTKKQKEIIKKNKWIKEELDKMVLKYINIYNK